MGGYLRPATGSLEEHIQEFLSTHRDLLKASLDYHEKWKRSTTAKAADVEARERVITEFRQLLSAAETDGPIIYALKVKGTYRDLGVLLANPQVFAVEVTGRPGQFNPIPPVKGGW